MKRYSIFCELAADERVDKGVIDSGFKPLAQIAANTLAKPCPS